LVEKLKFPAAVHAEGNTEESVKRRDINFFPVKKPKWELLSFPVLAF
jgi:hypothetical protein